MEGAEAGQSREEAGSPGEWSGWVASGQWS